jgi:SAM-dependent methyltransferase
MKQNTLYRCPEAGCNRAQLVEESDGLHCPNAHHFPYIEGTNVPVFACQPEEAHEYTLEDAAAIHDNSLRWVFNTFGSDESTLRRSLISRLRLSGGQTILVTGAGAGNDLPYLMQSMNGAGVIYAQDIAKQMLIAGVNRHGAHADWPDIKILFSASDATRLPFDDRVFDAAYHFGGINLFPDIRRGIAEMDRVVKPGGRVVICDEGAAPWLKQTELGRMLIKNNPLYAFDAPLPLMPETAREVNLSWEVGNCFYLIDYTVCDKPLDINIDVPHLGKRGGSIRTRYSGQLEGVTPALRDRIYAEAESLGLSRVEYIERLLKRES